MDMGKRRPRRGAPLCTRWALKRRRDTPSISQCLRATNGTDMRQAVEYAHGREEGSLGNRTVNREPLPGVLDTATAP